MYVCLCIAYILFIAVAFLHFFFNQLLSSVFELSDPFYQLSVNGKWLLGLAVYICVYLLYCVDILLQFKDFLN